jgi:hypothetical protein
MSFISLIRKKFFNKKFNDVGHIHFYSKYSILLKIEYCGFKIVDKIYAKNRLEHFSIKEFSIKKFLIIPGALTPTNGSIILIFMIIFWVNFTNQKLTT